MKKKTILFFFSKAGFRKTFTSYSQNMVSFHPEDHTTDNNCLSIKVFSEGLSVNVRLYHKCPRFKGKPMKNATLPSGECHVAKLIILLNKVFV
jgi:hypothetical protein